jgi:hypothetical protein
MKNVAKIREIETFSEIIMLIKEKDASLSGQKQVFVWIRE